MLDIKLVRKNPMHLEALLKTKDPEISLAPIVALDEKSREIKLKVEELK